MDSAPGLRKSKNISIVCKHYNDRLPLPPAPPSSGTPLQLKYNHRVQTEWPLSISGVHPIVMEINPEPEFLNF